MPTPCGNGKVRSKSNRTGPLPQSRADQSRADQSREADPHEFFSGRIEDCDARQPHRFGEHADDQKVVFDVLHAVVAADNLGLVDRTDDERRRVPTARGRPHAKANGVKFGRKPTLTPHQQKEARKRLEAGETQRSVARSYNVSQSTISRLCPSTDGDRGRVLMFANPTWNQHFLPQVDQKLNAINRAATKPRIYAFSVADREHYKLALEGRRLISSNLSITDLFTFDISSDDRRIRENFESLFATYETNVEIHINSLLAELAAGNSDLKKEVIELFAEKLLNFARNPFCIEKVLNTFRTLPDFTPTDPLLLDAYNRIVTGNKPHQTYVCAQLGITEQMYQRWLRLLLMLLFRHREGFPNIFEDLLKTLVEEQATYMGVVVQEFDNHTCLLSDRGFCHPIPTDEHLIFSFNLCANAFVDYAFMDIRTQMKGFPDTMIDRVIEDRMPHMKITHTKNNMAMLERYNKRVIDQCYQHVFSASRTVWLG
jgi:Helix-turn-helix domain of resolvase